MSGRKPKVLEDVAGRNRSSWRQRCASSIAELQSQLDRIDKNSGGLPSGDKAIADMARKHLGAAREAVEESRGLGAVWMGSAVDRAWPNIHKAEEAVLRLSPEDELCWWGATVLAKAEQHLGESDPRRALLAEHLENNDHRLHKDFKDLAVRTLQAANECADAERAKVRTFRNFLLASVLALATLAMLAFVWGLVSPETIAEKMCFYPNSIRTCPAGSGTAYVPSANDVLLVEFVGMCAAALAGAISLRNIQGTSTPYMVPMALMLLRLPAGALSAFIGILLIRGGFIPGLTNLDSGTQILAWAAFFGIAQESITRLIDQQGNRVLENVRSSMRGFDAEPEAGRAEK
ncbi:hypothetical protein GCM10010193_38380 [Kitasatospora atroaurantiaca]|uniref:Uncharacterized protein n=1 Tax=Kitasatospora atroaurantiaca TaxID=285545 RepID=A0A561EUG2_9ACTN|nr:hypothetical protein [Kitasatospora atroaurantiaca]TWE19227.1 hypothetical protein FB465_4341 [Kitasatospora atroaurantiaca]